MKIVTDQGYAHTLKFGRSEVSDFGRPDTTSFARYADVAKLLAAVLGELLSFATARTDRHGRAIDCRRAMMCVGAAQWLVAVSSY